MLKNTKERLKKNGICWGKTPQYVGLQSVLLCKSLIRQLLTFPDVPALQVLHIHLPATVMHRWFTAIKSIYEVHKRAGKEPLYFRTHEWVQALILGYFNPLIWWITIPDITIKHLKMNMNGLGGHFLNHTHSLIDTNELLYWYLTALIAVLVAFMQIYITNCGC